MPRPHLKTTPQPRRRALGLIRVSKERDGMTSPDVQRHAIEQWAANNNTDIIEWVEGLDESGSRARSAWWPRLDQSIDRLEQGEIDLIVVWKFSRTARHRLRWAIALDRVDALGGGLISATEPIDTTTSHGRLARGMVGEFNAYQAELIGDTWAEAHARRFREGKPINGKPRFGYQYSRENGFTPDPITGPILAETYRRYIAGESVYSLVAWLNSGPTRPVGGYGAKSDGLWSDRTLRRVLDSGFAAGLITYHGETKRGIHQPLITETEWEAYQEARGRRRTYRRTERSEYTYSGMVWCSCGSKMHGGIYGGVPRYRCKDGKEKRTHAGGYVSEEVIDAAVLKWLREREDRINTETADALERQPRRPQADPTAALRKRLSDVHFKLDNLIEDRRTIPQASFERLRDKYTAEIESLEQELRTVEVRRSAPIRVLPILLDRWEDLEKHEKREYLRSIIDRVVVTPGRPVAHVEVHGRE